MARVLIVDDERVMRESRTAAPRWSDSRSTPTIKPFGIDILRETVSRLLGGI